MLKKEHIRQAIAAISKRDAEIGYVLDEMMGQGAIRPVAERSEVGEGEDFHFTFNGRPARVKKVIFFNQGTVPIEERLLVKYGEMITQQQVVHGHAKQNFMAAARTIRLQGLRFMVNHEIAHALEQVRHAADSGGPAQAEAGGAHSRLQAIKRAQQTLSEALAQPQRPEGIDVLYAGSVDADMPAYFMRFPFCMDALTQAADMNLEFFNIRFLLSCLVRSGAPLLFACVVDGRIEGIVYLTIEWRYFYRALEIKYIATAGGRPASDEDAGRRQLKGVGTFLTAGVWILWKNCLPNVKELLLDAEIGSRRFYQGVGFQSRGLCGFVMKQPAGRLVKAILEMAGRCRDLDDRATTEVIRIIKKQIGLLRKKKLFQKDKIAVSQALEALKPCFQADFTPALTRAALEELTRYFDKIPQAEELTTLLAGKQ